MNIRKTILLAIAAVMLQAAVGCSVAKKKRVKRDGFIR